MPEWLEFVLVPLGVLAFLLAALSIVGYVSGWRKLAEKYPDRAASLLKKFQALSARVGMISYNSALTVDVCDEGLRFAVPRLLDPFSKPFFLKWHDFQVQRRSFLWIEDYALLKVGTQVIALHPLTANAMWRASKGQWPEQGELPSFPILAHVVRDYFYRWLFLSSLIESIFIALCHFGPGVGLPAWFLIVPPAVLAIILAVMAGVDFTRN